MKTEYMGGMKEGSEGRVVGRAVGKGEGRGKCRIAGCYEGRGTDHLLRAGSPGQSSLPSAYHALQHLSHFSHVLLQLVLNLLHCG